MTKECNNMCMISAASLEEVEDLYALKVGAFSKYLLYTIYQSPRSVVYLQTLLMQGSDRTGNFFFVAKHESSLVGYYHAVRHGPAFFLNYLTVAEEARRLGIGSQLLRHYETTAGTLGCNVLELDVFESNSGVCEWYCKARYAPRSFASLASLALGWEGESRYEVDFEPEVWHLACQEERERGFSKFACVCGPGKLTLGLIAEHVCKLMSFENITMEDAVVAINSRFSGMRDALIVSSQEIPANWPLLASETIITLSKSLCTA
jgi:GNAT superfamily N-acetyltransferase